MSMQYCENCDKQIDTDYDAEHFDECKYNEPQKQYIKNISLTFLNYLHEKMDKDEKEGLIINRELVEGYLQELIEVSK